MLFEVYSFTEYCGKILSVRLRCAFQDAMLHKKENQVCTNVKDFEETAVQGSYFLHSLLCPSTDAHTTSSLL